jgi:hypothetical protein
MKRKNSGDIPVAAVPAGGCDDATGRVHGQSVTAMVEVAWMVNGDLPDRWLLDPRTVQNSYGMATLGGAKCSDASASRSLLAQVK